MKKKILTILASVLVIAAAFVTTMYIIPSAHAKECRTRVYSDMEAQLDTVRDSVIGVVPKTESDGAVSYGGGGSGVIFAKEDQVYYAVTAAHCVSKENSTFKVYTTKTEDTKEESLGEAAELLNIHDESFYEAMSDATIEYVSDTTDLAIISFTSQDDLTVAEIAQEDSKVGDHLMCIGNPEGESFTVTYGEVTSLEQTITTVSQSGDDKERTYTVSEHNAYINFGNSGGPAFNTDMKVAGINTSGALNLLGIFDSGDMVPCSVVQQCIAEWKKN